MKRTVLYDTHRSLGAKMAPFAGWEMPIQYAAGPIEEHRLVRRSAGLFDTCHMGRIRVYGPGATRMLDKLLTARLSDVAVGYSRYSLLLREDGGVLDDLFVYRLGEEEWFIVVNASNAEKDLAWFQQWASKEGPVQVEDLSTRFGMIALQGPRALELLSRITRASDGEGLVDREGNPDTKMRGDTPKVEGGPGKAPREQPVCKEQPGNKEQARPNKNEQLETQSLRSREPGQTEAEAAKRWTPPERFGWAWVEIGTVDPASGSTVNGKTADSRGMDMSRRVRCLVGRTGYTGEDGVEIFPPWDRTPFVWDAILSAARKLGIEAGPAGLAARDSLRFEPGFALYGHELSEDITPVEASLLWACDLEKPFVGRDAVLKRKEEGPKEKLATFVMEDQAVPRAGYPVADETGKTVGRVVTGLYAPTLDVFAGNAFVVPDLAGSGKTIYIVVRGALKRARVVKRPLYKPAYRS